MPRPKGSPNKLTTEVKTQLQKLIDKVVNRKDVDAMTTDQKHPEAISKQLFI